MTRNILPFLTINRTKYQVSIPEKLALARLSSELNKKILSGVEYSHLLDFIFNSLNLTIPFDRIGVATIEEVNGKNHLILKWVRSKYSSASLIPLVAKPIDGSCIEELLAAGKPKIINDLSKLYEQNPGSETLRLLWQDGIRSNLTCPLRIDGRNIGVVFFSCRKVKAYNEEHIDTFLELANEIALIIEYGRMRKKCSLDPLNRNIGTILHDLKSPLNVIQGFADNVQYENWFQNLDPSAKEIFSIFRRNSKKMLSTLENLLKIAELNRQADSFCPGPVNLSEFLEEMKKYGETLSQPKEIHFVTDFHPLDHKIVYFDKEGIARALDNLFSNAIKYSVRGSRILFKVESHKNSLDFSVQDSGVGIKAEEIPQLFKEFGRTSSRPTEGESSTGLGLAIVKKIIELHGGKIFVNSVFGKGSKFEFRIPLISIFS